MIRYRKRYTTSLSASDFNEIIEKIIDINEEDTFKNHWSYDRGRNGDLVKGITKNSEALLWRTNGSWNGMFYPVFHLKLENKTVMISSRFNKSAEAITIILTALYLIGCYELVFGPGSEFPQIFYRFLLGVFVFLVFMSPFLFSFYHVKNQTLKELRRVLKLTDVTR